MSNRIYDISGYRSMWLFALFDLPVKEKEDKRQYTRFRKMLLRQGFTMLQYSVYARHCASEETNDIYRNHIKSALPPDGQVRLLGVQTGSLAKWMCFLEKNAQKSKTRPPSSSFFRAGCGHISPAIHGLRQS